MELVSLACSCVNILIRFIETLGPSQRLDLLEQDSKLKVFYICCHFHSSLLFVPPPSPKNKVKELLYDLKNYHQTFYPLLSCLHHLTHDLPDAPLGRKVTLTSVLPWKLMVIIYAAS